MNFSCRRFPIGRQSSLGPVDPFVAIRSRRMVLFMSFDRALAEIQTGFLTMPLWPAIVSNSACVPWRMRKVDEVVNRAGDRWLSGTMFKGEKDAGEIVGEILKEIIDIPLAMRTTAISAQKMRKYWIKGKAP